MRFDHTSEGKGDRCTSSCASTKSYFYCHEWGPHTDGPHSCQIVRAKASHNTSFIQCWEKHFLDFAPNRTLGKVCLWEHAELEGESKQKRIVRLDFPEIHKSVVSPSVLHVVGRSFLVFRKNSFPFVSIASLCSLEDYSNVCPSVSDGDQGFCKDKNYPVYFKTSTKKAQNHLPHEKCFYDCDQVYNYSVK